MIKQTRVRKAATGWTTRMAEREFRALEGRLKSPLSLSFVPKMFSISLAYPFRSQMVKTYQCHIPPWLLCIATPCNIQTLRNQHSDKSLTGSL
jgi:hypothetical protein